MGDRRTRWIGGGLAGLVAALVAVAVLATPSAHPTAGRPASPAVTASAAPATPVPTADAAAIFPRAGAEDVADRPWFLVVGDSISFGLTVDPRRFGTNSSWVTQIQPMLGAGGPVADDLACPGETTASYASACPLVQLARWLSGTSQRSAALDAVRAHATTLRFIVVELGANDLLNARRDGVPLTTTLAQLYTRLSGIVGDLAAAAPGVRVILANLYDPYAPSDLAASQAVDQADAAIAAVAAERNAAVADWHAAINGGAVPLGTLVDLAHGDVHPTVEGHRALATEMLAVLERQGLAPLPGGAPLAVGQGGG
ncbi:MAG TPA: SGNH/GDSL hydrolase family protein [Candidatus Dormibacteraeota bacterium]